MLFMLEFVDVNSELVDFCIQDDVIRFNLEFAYGLIFFQFSPTPEYNKCFSNGKLLICFLYSLMHHVRTQADLTRLNAELHLIVCKVESSS